MGARDINCLALVQVEAPSQQKTPKFKKSHKIGCIKMILRTKLLPKIAVIAVLNKCTNSGLDPSRLHVTTLTKCPTFNVD